MGHTKHVRLGLLSLGFVALGWTLTDQFHVSAAAQSTTSARDEARRSRFTNNSNPDAEGRLATAAAVTSFSEAPAAFDNLTNGFDVQGPPFDSIEEDNVNPLASFNDNRFIFEEVEKIADGLGPTYNAQSCRECHQNVVTGGASQVTEQRAGRVNEGQFFDSQGGSLIASRATHPDATELVADRDTVRTFRISTNVLGAGFIEAVSNSLLLAIRDAQPSSMRGLAVNVPVLEAGNFSRVGRFGWKSQHASLESFAADAYLNEMGITSPLFREENTSAGRDVSQFDPVDRSRGRRCRCRRVRQLHALDEGAAARRHHVRGAGRRAGVQPHRMRNLPCAVARDVGAGHRHQRRQAHGPGEPRQQGLSPVQRFPAARHRHRRRDSDPADAGIRADHEPDPDGSAVGAPDAQSLDARRAVVHQG